MIEDYFNKTAEWKHVTGTDDYNQSTYETRQIPCMIIDKIKLVRDKTGTQVVSSSQVFAVENIQLGDLINGRLVISIGSLDLLDSNEGIEVYLA